MVREMMNFRVTPATRRLLRIALFQDGQTIQSFFAGVVDEKIKAACERHGAVRVARQEMIGESEDVSGT